MKPYTISKIPSTQRKNFFYKMMQSVCTGLLCVCMGLVQVQAQAHSQAIFANMEISTMQIPVSISWAEMAQKINQQLRGLIYEAKDMVKSGENEFDIKVWKLKPIEVSGSKEGLQTQAAIRINIKGIYKTRVMGLAVSQQIDQDLKLNVSLSTQLRIDTDWTIQSKSQLVKYEWIEQPYMQFGFLKIPLSSVIEPIIEEQKELILAEVDTQIKANVRFKDAINAAWRQFQTPFPASEWGEEKTWLWFKPSKPLLGPLQYLEEGLQVNLHLEALSESVLAIKPQKISIQPLTAPTYTREISQAQASLWVYGYTDYATAQAKAKETFSKTPYSFRNSRYVVYVKDVAFTQEGEVFKIELDLNGTVNGRVYLQGKPYFNPKTKKFEIEDFAYNTEDADVKISKFMRWMFAKKIKRQIQKGFEDALEAQIEDIRKAVKQNLASYQFDQYSQMLGEVEEFYFDKIWIEQDTVKVRAHLKGVFEVQLSNF